MTLYCEWSLIFCLSATVVLKSPYPAYSTESFQMFQRNVSTGSQSEASQSITVIRVCKCWKLLKLSFVPIGVQI